MQVKRVSRKHASRERISREYVESFGIPGASDAWGLGLKFWYSLYNPFFN
jgi:hypothetical protein